ncbi:arrestin domain-containing protein 5-like [Eublepharis macularius]|uniref:Arrestin domain-containing protein 5-like n=1 Tax=Eublepharis macularius TaxID=481883 RepID=A0AA97JDL3_EUBMA|nr:arrestin domain-containing protein 5-like [Eublepharis macularius]XP_054835543.1 arrestin domain-containing protein 5-like [Eublepharis macularius]
MSVVKSIELVVPRDVYVSGSEVDGQVVLSLHSTLINPLVKVELIGRGYLEWTEEAHVNRDYSQDLSCVNRADYVHKKKTFDIEGNWLDPGTHTFNFSFVLPPRIPSTFTSQVGRICYFLQAICATRELILAKQKKYLQVQGTSVCLQDTIESEYPLVVEEEKLLHYSCCFKSAPITLRISLCKNIFAPGDNITFTTEITNRTGKSIKKAVFILHSVVLYKGFNLRAELRTLEERNDLLRLESHLEAGSCVDTKIHSTLLLPKVMLVTSSHKSEDIMDVGYELTGTVYFPCMTTITARIPIIIRSEAVDLSEQGRGQLAPHPL